MLEWFPYPHNLWCKCGIMWPDLVGRVGRSVSNDDADICCGPPAVPTDICVADVLTLAQGALGVK